MWIYEIQVVKVWDVDTGAQVFEYGCAHGQAGITSMAFDSNGRRLETGKNLAKYINYSVVHLNIFLYKTPYNYIRLVTGGRDGCLKMWNFNNGECLKILRAGHCFSSICLLLNMTHSEY